MHPPVRLVAGTLVGLIASVGVAAAQSILSLHDEATGTTQVFVPSDAYPPFSVWGDGSTINVHVPPDYYLHFEAPEGQKLAPGAYPGAGCRKPQRHGRAPGLEVTNNNPACGPDEDTQFGSFTIRQVGYGAGGEVESLEAVFIQRLGSPTAPALGGLVRIDARPLAFHLQSGARSAWGRREQHHHGNSSLFSMEGSTASGMAYEVSGLKHKWQVLITPPAGRLLATGRYATKAVADVRHAGLQVQLGDHETVECANPSGSIDIQKLVADERGAVKRLRAQFQYRCAGRQPPLRGTIRHGE